MDILFKDRYIRNKQIFKEIYAYYFLKRKPLIFCFSMLLVIFALNIVTAITIQNYSLFIFISVPVTFALHFLIYYNQVKTILKRDAEISNEEIQMEVTVTDERIESVASTGAVSTLKYENIKKAVQTKNVILLITKARLLYIFKKDGFEIGSADDFISFIESKGISINKTKG